MIDKGKIIEFIIIQNPEIEIPIISPNEFVSEVVAFKYPFIKNSIIPSIAIPNKLLKKSPFISL